MAANNRDALERELSAVEAELHLRPATVELDCRRAGLLATLGRIDEARQLYLAILQRDPVHFATLNNFGSLLYETDFRTAARTVFAHAVQHHPSEPLGHVNLANALMYADETGRAREHYEIALRLDPGNVLAHQRLSALLHDLGDIEGMRRHRRLGFADNAVRDYPYLGEGEPIALLLLVSTPAGDLPWARLVDDRVFAATTLVAEFHDPATPLPPHDLIFNTIGDADLSRADLLVARDLVARSSAPVINPPDKVLPTGRMENATRLAAFPGVRTPRIASLPRAAFEAPDAADTLRDLGLDFPLLLRAPGFHTGRHFVRVDRPDALAPAVAALPGPELMAMEYLDATGPDGYARKYRAMTIGGRLYPLHLAMSQHWKVHYFTGAMHDHPGFQAEEARFLEDMPTVIGARGMAALEAIQEALGLDYGGVDFAIAPDGELLVFEANAVMNIVMPDASAQWNYRRPAIDRAAAAARAMVTAKAGA